jgi:hypothetical protein
VLMEELDAALRKPSGACQRPARNLGAAMRALTGPIFKKNPTTKSYADVGVVSPRALGRYQYAREPAARLQSQEARSRTACNRPLYGEETGPPTWSS